MKQRKLLNSSTVRTLGFDPALRHGVIVLDEWLFHGDDAKAASLIKATNVCEWDDPGRRIRGMLGAESTTDEIQTSAQWIVASVAKHPVEGVPMGIDWHPRSVFWGNRKAGTVMTYLMGYLTRAFELLGVPVVHFNPEEVRQSFGLARSTSKQNVWDQISFFDDTVAYSSDERDAHVLAFLVAEGLRSRDERQTS